MPAITDFDLTDCGVWPVAADAIQDDGRETEANVLRNLRVLWPTDPMRRLYCARLESAEAWSKWANANIAATADQRRAEAERLAESECRAYISDDGGDTTAVIEPYPSDPDCQIFVERPESWDSPKLILYRVPGGWVAEVYQNGRGTLRNTTGFPCPTQAEAVLQLAAAILGEQNPASVSNYAVLKSCEQLAELAAAGAQVVAVRIAGRHEPRPDWWGQSF